MVSRNCEDIGSEKMGEFYQNLPGGANRESPMRSFEERPSYSLDDSLEAKGSYMVEFPKNASFKRIKNPQSVFFRDIDQALEAKEFIVSEIAKDVKKIRAIDVADKRNHEAEALHDRLREQGVLNILVAKKGYNLFDLSGCVSEDTEELESV